MGYINEQSEKRFVPFLFSLFYGFIPRFFRFLVILMLFFGFSFFQINTINEFCLYLGNRIYMLQNMFLSENVQWYLFVQFVCLSVVLSLIFIEFEMLNKVTFGGFQ